MKGKDFILVESGATKSDWALVDGDGKVTRRFVRPGMNVSTMDIDTVRGMISDTVKGEGLQASGFYLYTAGLVTDAIREAVKEHVRSICGISDVDVQEDLMGAARAVCGHESGIAAILGTGSNACFYDGVSVHRKVYSGGFILGDEGGAATLGKLFLSDYLKGLVPAELASDFEKGHDASYAAIVEGVYRSASPSGYLGSIAPFITGHRHVPYAAELIRNNFRSFIDRVLARYDISRYPLGVVGGFAWACRDILLPLLEENGIKLSCLIKAPAEGLCRYHLR